MHNVDSGAACSMALAVAVTGAALRPNMYRLYAMAVQMTVLRTKNPHDLPTTPHSH